MKLGTSASYWDGIIKKVKNKTLIEKKKVKADCFVPQKLLVSNLEGRFEQILVSRKFIHLFFLTKLIQ